MILFSDSITNTSIIFNFNMKYKANIYNILGYYGNIELMDPM